MDMLLKKMGMNQTRHQLKSLKSSITKKESINYNQEKQIFDKNVHVRSNTKTSQFIISSLKDSANASQQIIPSNLIRSQGKILYTQRQKSQMPIKNVIVKRPNKIQIKNKLSTKYQIKNLKVHEIKQIQKNHLIQDHQSSGETKKLQEIVEYLRYKLSSKCLLPNHEHNKTTFICFESSCKNRLGCSYCFLSTHQSHVKCQINTCIEDLEETIFKVKANQQLMSKKVNSFCEEFYMQMNTQVQKIRQQFEINIGFLKDRLINDFNISIRQEYESYLKKFKPRNVEVKNLNNSEAKSQLKQDEIKIQQNHLKTNKMKFKDETKQQKILSNFNNFKIDEIYLYLRKRLEKFHQKVSETQTIFQFLNKVNYSISQIFSVCKKGIPKVNQKKLVIEKPNLLDCSKFNLD